MMKFPACVRLARFVRLCVAAAAVLGWSALASAQQPPVAPACLLFSAENLVKGGGGGANWYAYVEFSKQRHTVQKGDALEYDIFLPESNPVMKGGIDALFSRDKLPQKFEARPWLRDSGLKDQNGLTVHGDAILDRGKGQWYHRVFDLSSLDGVTLENWSAVFEGDDGGRYTQFLAGIRIVRDGKTVLTIPADAGAKTPEYAISICDGYSRNALVSALAKEEKMDGVKVGELIDRAKKGDELRLTREQFNTEIDVARNIAKRLKDDKLLAEIDAAAKAGELGTSADPAKALAAIHDARHKLGHAHPEMEKITGHLVGHAHIDLQWLWTWDDCIDHIIPDTFGQAVKFMKEFPDFTFSQSSACLYLATEEHHPELFKEIQKYVKEGRWELVGGRWCEGDNNMISPESHVRHFLYGQRYFMSRFGKMCTVGWEPDTFGHCWTMPQILRKSGIDSYYYCRPEGKDPLFWWEGPDGSKVLTFNEPASGGWYNGPVDEQAVKEIGQFVGRTNAMDHLIVYGVGNHGGGPTRENILAALAMKQRGLLPSIKFSTASEFFGRLHAKASELTAPTKRGELNTIFEGCYTSQGAIKKGNRDCESLLESAEVMAALARLDDGPAYAREAFESMWRDVTWTHHHDTLPGSLIHPSALFTRRVFDGVLERGGAIRERSESAIAARAKVDGKGPHVFVFNPLAWTRSEVVEVTVTLPASEHLHAARDAQGDVPTQLIEQRTDGDVTTARICFVAREVPGCGYKAYSLDGDAHVTLRKPAKPAAAMEGSSLMVLRERPHGMSAWSIGEYVGSETLDKPISRRVIEDGPVRTVTRTEYRWDASTIVEERITYAAVTGMSGGRVDYRTTVDWGQLGNATDGSPLLKAAFATGVKSDNATFEIPFGDISRPADGRESPALKWCDLSGTDAAGKSRGVTVLNDCKHGYDVKDGVVRLTLLRASYEPDPCPDVGTHVMRYATVAHDGGLDKGAASRAAWEFNKPLRAVAMATLGAPSARTAVKDRPAAWSGCSAGPSNIVVTGLKRSEDGDDVIVRAYECAGKLTTATIDLGFEFASASETDLLERDMMKPSAQVEKKGRAVVTEFKPYEIRTFRVKR